MASSSNLVSTIGAQSSPTMGDGTRCPEGYAFPAGMPHPLQMINYTMLIRNVTLQFKKVYNSNKKFTIQTISFTMRIKIYAKPMEKYMKNDNFTIPMNKI